jgi:hypothetical protein
VVIATPDANAGPTMTATIATVQAFTATPTADVIVDKVINVYMKDEIYNLLKLFTYTQVPSIIMLINVIP